jgi:Fe-S oxidoreductase
MPPLGLGYLAAVLEKNGIGVKIVDCLLDGWNERVDVSDNDIRIGLSFDKIEKIVRSYKPDMVGLNNLFTKQRENAHKIYEIAKKIDKNIVTVGGGAHPTVMPELAMSDKNLDYVILGEGEVALMCLIESIEGRRDISSVDGIGYRYGGNIKILPKKNFIADLDSLPFPARHLMSMDRYFGLKVSHGDRWKKRFSPIITSRGCPAKCTFCSAHAVWGRPFRFRSPDNVIKELKEVKEKYGIEEIMFEDDNLTLNPARAEAIFNGMIKEKLGLEWDTPNGVAAWTLSERLIDKMKESGCRTINFALESGSQRVLDEIIKKPLNLIKVKPLVKYAKKIGLDVGIFLVAGMPGENENDIWDSFHLAAELGVFMPHISIATPYPGSELYGICKESGYLKPDFTLNDLFIRSFSITTPEMPREKLEKILSEGERYLLISFLKKHPFELLKVIIGKLFKEPAAFFKKLFAFISSNNWTKLR